MGNLPWQGLSEEAILESKRTITTHNLFLGLPVEFHTFFEHCRSLRFELKPNYDHYYDLFGDLMLREGFQHDTPFNWDVAGGKNRLGCTCTDQSGTDDATTTQQLAAVTSAGNARFDDDDKGEPGDV